MLFTKNVSLGRSRVVTALFILGVDRHRPRTPQAWLEDVFAESLRLLRRRGSNIGR